MERFNRGMLSIRPSKAVSPHVLMGKSGSTSHYHHICSPTRSELLHPLPGYGHHHLSTHGQEVSSKWEDHGGTTERKGVSKAFVISVSMLKMVKEQLLY